MVSSTARIIEWSSGPHRRARRFAAALAAVAFGPGTAPAAEPACRPATLEAVAPGVFVRPARHGVVFEQAGVANIGFVVGRRCVAVVDTGGSLEEGEALRCAISQTTELAVCYVINTHAHPDHMLGNLAFRQPGVTFVGHAKLARALALLGGVYLRRASAQAGRVLGPEHIVEPQMTVDEHLELDLGERVLHVSAQPPAHTDHDLTVYDTTSGTLWAGDLVFLQHVPVIDGSVLGWQHLLPRLAQLSAQRVVPGHGPPAAPWPAAADDTLRYLRVLSTETRAWLARGEDLQQAQDTIGYVERTRWQLFHEYHKRNVAAAVTELEWE